MGRRGVAVDAHADAVWAFEPLIGVGSLPPESQSYAAEVYAQVTEKMLPEITEAVAKGSDVCRSALRCNLSGALADELQQGLVDAELCAVRRHSRGACGAISLHLLNPKWRCTCCRSEKEPELRICMSASTGRRQKTLERW